jgi:hypothetical protein
MQYCMHSSPHPPCLSLPRPPRPPPGPRPPRPAHSPSNRPTACARTACRKPPAGHLPARGLRSGGRRRALDRDAAVQVRCWAASLSPPCALPRHVRPPTPSPPPPLQPKHQIFDHPGDGALPAGVDPGGQGPATAISHGYKRLWKGNGGGWLWGPRVPPTQMTTAGTEPPPPSPALHPAALACAGARWLSGGSGRCWALTTPGRRWSTWGRCCRWAASCFYAGG